MSKNIDERVVEMRFDNQHFEKNVSETMSTLDKFKEKLKFTGATKGLENVGDAAKKVNITPLSNAAETVRLKFSALEVMAVTALQNITNTAVNAGKRIVSAFTIDPIKTGFQEYETQINSVQTILANTESKGSTLKDVNKALDELNTYADKTIYNFTQMTRNIGTFTAAGVDLDTSVAAIKGIANLAAVSGSTSQQASTAMYQLSQALASGTVKLMDWNSVVNAGMGGQVFQDALKETARIHGIAIDQMIKDEGSFRNTLSNGWLSSEILTETLAKFTGDLTESQLKTMGYAEDQIAGIMKLGKTANDAATKVKTFSQLFDTLKEAAQSGWAQTWKIIIGDFEEAKELFSEVSDAFGKIIGDASDARNSLFKGAFDSKWDTLEAQITGLGISFDDFQDKLKATARSHGVAIDDMIEKEGSIEKTLKNGWLTSDIFSETIRGYTKDIDATNNELDALAKSLTQFGDVVDQVMLGNFGNGEERVHLLTKAGYDYATIQDLVNKVLSDTTGELEKLSEEQLKNLGYTEEQITAIRLLAEESEKSGTSINQLLNDLARPSGRELLIDTFRNALKSLGMVIGDIRKAWKEAFPPMTSEQLYGIIAAVHKFSEKLRKAVESVTSTEDKVGALRRTFRGLFAIIEIITTFTGGALKAGLKLIGKLFGLVDVPVLELTAHLGDLIVQFRDWLFTNSILAKGFEALVNGVVSAAKAIKDWFNSLDPLTSTQTRFEKFKTTFVKAFTEFGKILQNGIDKVKGLGKNIVDCAKKLKAWVDEFMKIPAVHGALERFKKGAANVLEAITKSFGACKQSFSEFINKLKSLDKLTFQDVINALKELGKNIIKNFSGIGGSFSYINEALNTLKKEVKRKLGETWVGFEEFLNKIAGFGQSVKERIGSIDLGGILLAALGIGTLTIGSKIGDAIEALTAPLSGFGELLKGLATNVKSVSGVLKAAKLTILAGGFVALATGILILAGAVALLTLLDQKKLWSAVGAMVALGGVLLALAAVMAAINKGIQNVGTNIAAILAIAGAVLVLVISLKMLNSMKPDRILANVLTLGTIMGALVAVALILSKKTPTLFAGSVALMAFSAAVLILVGALKGISNIKTNNLLSSMGVLLAIMGGLALVTKVCRTVDKNGAITALAAVLVLKILVGVIKDFAEIKMETILSALISLIPILGMIAVVMASTKLAGKHAAKAGAAILLISASLILMVTAIRQLSKIDPKMLAAPLATIAALMALISGVIAASKLAGKNAVKASAMLLMMAGALTIISLIVLILSKVDADGLWRGVGAIAALTACVAGLMFMTKYVKALKGAKGMLITLIVAIGVLALAISVIANLDSENVLAATVAMVSVMGMFALLMLTVTKIKNLGKKALPTIALLTLVVVALGGVLYLLGGLDPENNLATATALSALILALSAACTILSKIKTVSVAGLASVAILTAIVAALGGILLWLKDLNPESTIATAVGLSTLILALSGVCAILTVVGTAAGPALIGIGVLAALIVAIGALMVAIGALVSGFPQINEWLDMAIVVFEKIGYGIGSFVGGIVGGLADGIMSGLPAIATSLSQFMTNLQPFFDGLNSVTPSMLESALNLAGIILALTAANIVNQIGSLLFGGNDIGNFSAQLLTLGEGIAAFSGAVKGTVDAEAVETAANAGKMLTALADTVPNTGGLLGFIVGNNDIAYFATQLPILADGIVAFSQKVKGNVDAEAVEIAKNAGLMLTALADTVPNSGGLLGFLAGNNDIDKFGEQLPILADGIVSFSQKVKGNVDAEAVEIAKNAGLMLTALADTVPNSGGLLGFLVGNNDIDKFGEKLPLLADGIVGFSQKVVGSVDIEAVEVAKNAGQLLIELANTIPNTGGLLGFLNGDNDIAKFAEKLPLLADGITAFSQKVAGSIDMEAITIAKNAGETLVALSNTVPNTGGLFNFINGESNKISAFSEKLPLLADGITSFSQIVSGKVDKASVETASNAGKVLADLSSYVNDSTTGGLLSFLVSGSIAAFSEQLPLLADGIVTFSDKVKDSVDTNAVTAATNAGTLIATLSSNITESTGNWLYNLFGGDTKKFKNFKEQMPLLGDAIVAFSKSITGKIDASAVTSAKTVSDVLAVLMKHMTAASAKDISKFSENINNLGDSLLSLYDDLSKINLSMLTVSIATLDGAMNDIASWVGSIDPTKLLTFGNSLSTLGTKIKQYSKNLTSIKLDDFEASLNVVSDMINLTMDMAEVDTAGVNAFTSSLEKLGKTGVSTFVKAFKDAEEQIRGAANGMMTTFCEAISGDTETLATTFGAVATAMLNRINGKKQGSVGANTQERFKTAGETLITKFSSGISSDTSKSAAEIAIGVIITAMVNKAKSKDNYDALYNSGTYLGKGFANGIKATVNSAISEAKRLAESSATAMAKQLQERSPSKVTYEIGEFAGMGLVNALHDYANKAYGAGANLADSAKTGLSNAISKVVDALEDEIGTDPVIRPVLDLTNVESGARRLNTMFARSQVMAIDVGNHNNSANDQNGVNGSGKFGNTYQFTQNNYSPKALSRIDIYRQTKNQFSAMERMVEG